MKTAFWVTLKKKTVKINFILLAISAVFLVASCSSDDDNSEGDEMMQEEEQTTLDFNLLVDSWEAQDFVFEAANSSLPDTNFTGQGGTVLLEVSDNGDFTFTLMRVEPDQTFMNSGEFRVENNTLQARFEDEMSFRNLEAEVNQQQLMIEGIGLFDLSGEGSNISNAFRATFFRQ